MTKKKYSKDSIERADRIKRGAPTKYVEDTHIPLLFECFSNGKDIAQFCVEAGISRDAFFDWVRDHDLFYQAYKEARELGLAWYEEYARENRFNPNFNTQLFNIIMKNRFGYTQERRVKIKGLDKASTPTEQFNVIKSEVAQGNLTTTETTQLANFVATGANIEQATTIAKDVEMLKSQFLDKGIK